MFISLFIIARKYKQPKCSLIDKWIIKLWHIHIVKYYSAIKRSEVLIHATNRQSLENIMLNEKPDTKGSHIV